MEFFDYDTIGKTDDEIMQMAINFEEGRAGVTRLFWACELYLLLAERGNNEAIVRLVSRCARTDWLPKHYTISSAWFDIVKEELDRRIEQNDAEACRILALCYLDGIGCEVQDDQAVALLKKAINLNDYRSLNTLGWMVFKGRFDEGEPEDYYYRKAADNGVTVSMLNLALNAPNNSQEERYWLEKAVNLNHPRACFILGNRYMEDSDTKRAVELYKKAAELGYWESYEKLAEAYRHGRGVDENVNLAVYWYCMYGDINNDNNDDVFGWYWIIEYVQKHKDIIEKPILEKFFVVTYRGRGIMPSDYFLELRNEYHFKRFHDNRHWERGYKRIPSIIVATYLNTAFFGEFEEGKEDIFDEEVMKWLEKGEAIGDVATICFYGEALDEDRGKVQNKDKVIIEKLTKASELGFSRATYVLGKLYWEGQYVERNRRKAFDLIESVTEDYGPACLFMGNQYYYGNEIVERNYDLALYYWSLPECWTDSKGYTIAENKYYECVNNQVVVYNSVPIKMDKVKAHSLMENNRGDSLTARFNLAWMYQNGEGNYLKNRKKALELYTSKTGDSEEQKPAVIRATYNIAYIRFSEEEYDEAIKSFLTLKLSEQSYYQAICLSTYFYYCGYYDESGELVCKNPSLFNFSMLDLYKNRKEYSIVSKILFIRIMKNLVNHGRYGKKLYRNINMTGLKKIWYMVGDIPLQLEPEEEDTELNKIIIMTRNNSDSKEEKIHILENYIANMRDVDDKTDYYEGIMNWYMNNKDVINSPIMIAYWKDKFKSSREQSKMSDQKTKSYMEDF